MRYFIGTLTMIVLTSLGCAKKETVIQPIGEVQPIFEEVSPDTTDTSTVVFIEEPETTAVETSSIFKEVAPEEEITPEEKKPEVEVKKASGYRVQIGAYKDQAYAEKSAEKARKVLSQKVYVEYAMPYYKVRVGNFLNRAEAAQYRKQLINSGYKKPFIVETTINVE
ncbi:MAG: SPOR domain-containing protein [candidate division WOR-3 bacterium]|nr:SPOR domain-containing protein [candidate division WOR-3 bacterium]